MACRIIQARLEDRSSHHGTPKRTPSNKKKRPAADAFQMRRLDFLEKEKRLMRQSSPG